jgi:hypothetical protein
MKTTFREMAAGKVQIAADKLRIGNSAALKRAIPWPLLDQC